MKGHTAKHLIDTISDDVYDFYLYSSGGVLHTVKMVCSTNRRTEFHSFKGALQARAWIDQKVSRGRHFRDSEKPKSNRGGSRPGAGRKPVSGVTRTSRTIDLTPLAWEFLTAGGNTAASEIESRIRATKAFRDWKKSAGK